jgi:hypothetical protein
MEEAGLEMSFLDVSSAFLTDGCKADFASEILSGKAR